MIIKQKNLSEMKSDFVNNMTHELKTPIATLSLAGQMLNDKGIISSSSMLQNIAGIIEDETKRLSFQVEKVLQVALFENDKLKFSFDPIDINDLILKVNNSFSLQIQKLNGKYQVFHVLYFYKIVKFQKQLYDPQPKAVNHSEPYCPNPISNIQNQQLDIHQEYHQFAMIQILLR